MRSQTGDAALAVVVGAVGVVGTLGADHLSTGDTVIDARGVILILVAALSLAVRRRWPFVTLAVATVACTAYLLLAFPYGPILLTFFIAVYTVASRLPLVPAATGSVVALAVLITHVFTHPSALGGYVGFIPASAWMVVPFAVGVTVRSYRESVARDRAEVLREHVTDERLRVAQEVHDVVGHGLAAIKMQADVALHVLAKRPEQAEIALRAISTTSTEALEELRATLAVVRGDADEAERAPAARLARVQDLVDRMVESGTRVTLSTSGTPREVPAVVDLTAYRVVQESLTNVLRHGSTPVAAVGIGYETDAVVLSVINPAAATGVVDGGLGIPGMRQRVEQLGGEFSAGLVGRQFEVHARIPTGGPS